MFSKITDNISRKHTVVTSHDFRLYTQVHLQQPIEFACLEEQCRVSPLMCYICKEHGRHVNHKFELLDREASKLRDSITSALQHVNKFGAELTEHARKLDDVIEQIETTPQLVTVAAAGHDETSLQTIQVTSQS